MTGEVQADGREGAVRERLLAAAAESFALKGYAATTVREIVAAAGVTKPVLYYYFQNKEGLYLELMRDALVKFEALLDSIRAEQGSAQDKIFKLCDRFMVLLKENIRIARVYYAIYYGPPQGAPYFDCDVFHFTFRDTVGMLIQEGIGNDEFRRGDVTDMTWALLGAVTVAIEVEICHPDLSLGREGLARVLTLIFEGLKAVTAPKARSK